jgi:hypothetical protein
MNISELEISRKLRKITYATDDRIEQILDDHGWRKLGSGIEAMVAEKPGTPYVLKLFNSDSEYVHFVKYCQQNSTNKFLPRFSRYVRPVPGTQFSYVRMEKLFPITPDQLISRYPEYVCALVDMFKQPQGDVVWNHAMYAYNLDQIHVDLGYTSRADCAEQVPAQFMKTVQELIQIMNEHKLTQLDMHYNNMMRRANGDLVITDPFV